MHDRLVAGFDGSQISASAVRWAAEEAELRSATLRVVSSYALPLVMDFYGIGMTGASEADLIALEVGCTSALSTVVAEAAARHPSLKLEQEATQQPAIKALLHEGGSADLLVVGSSGAGAARAFWLGTVAGAMLHESPCPVVLVPQELADLTGRIVVGIDGSEHSDAALSWAVEEAGRRGADLHVVHAWEYPYRFTREGVGRAGDIAAADATVLVDNAVSAARAGHGGVVHGELIEGGATDVLLTAGRTADMVVLGPRGRGGFRSMLFGSVAHNVAAHAPCPVVIVR